MVRGDEEQWGETGGGGGKSSGDRQGWQKQGSGGWGKGDRRTGDMRRGKEKTKERRGREGET